MSATIFKTVSQITESGGKRGQPVKALADKPTT